MNKISVFVLTFLLCLSGLSAYAQVNNNQVIITNGQGDDIFYHTIERGQTVYAIATMYGVSVDDVYRLNPDSREGIRAGDVLRIPQRDVAAKPVETVDGEYIYHTIQAKETLYSLTLRYNVPATEIVRLNPGLTVSTFTIGKIIRIPATRMEDLPKTELKTVTKEMEYTVEKRETLYSISRKFKISSAEIVRHNPQVKDGLKAGMVLKIPVEAEAVVTEQPMQLPEREVNALLSESKKVERVDMLKVALLLPFTTNQPNAATRFVEYYEGLLMAVDSLRNTGFSLELSVYDTGDGTQLIHQILKEDALRDANLIIGAVQSEQIAPVAAFAKEHDIKYVIPFTSQNDDVLSNAQVFQVNTPHSYIYAKTVQAGCELFAQDNIIIVHTPDDREKADFIQAFKSEMEHKGISYKEITYDGTSFTEDIKAALALDKRNIVLPTSSSLNALNKIKSPLRTLTEMSAEGQETYSINLFGYPDWQTYTAEALEDMYALNTYIYTNFFADNLSPDVQYFYGRYKDWYSKNLINTFPKYGILGFDTGMFFFEAMQRYGVNFENSLERIRYKSLQTGFCFERVNNWGGFINTNVFIVQYRNDFTVTRHEIR